MKNGHNYSNLTQLLFYMHQQPVVLDHGTQYEDNPSSHRGGMRKDTLTEKRTDRLEPFLYSPILL